MKVYTLYWRNGDRELVQGDDLADAMARAGYGGGAAKALDFWAFGEDDNYRWDGNEWISK